MKQVNALPKQLKAHNQTPDLIQHTKAV